MAIRNSPWRTVEVDGALWHVAKASQLDYVIKVRNSDRKVLVCSALAAAQGCDGLDVSDKRSWCMLDRSLAQVLDIYISQYLGEVIEGELQ